jgi:hypothetical protein
MNRLLPYLLGPEIALTLLTALVIVYCSRHGSYSAQDVQAVQRLIWLVPLLAVLLAFGPIVFSATKSGWWLARANIAVLISLPVCTGKIIEKFAAPGAGPAGQEAGLVLMLVFAAGLTGLANAICGTMILGAAKPAFASWMRAHTLLGYLLTGVAMVPLAMVQATAASVSLAIVHSITSKR